VIEPDSRGRPKADRFPTQQPFADPAGRYRWPRDIHLPDAGPMTDAPRLRIRTSGPFGTLRIRGQTS
jgi:hypothetical protein